MPRKPNYRFERMERERVKAEKKAARLQARADKKAALAGEGEESSEDNSAEPSTAEPTMPNGESPQE